MNVREPAGATRACVSFSMKKVVILSKSDNITLHVKS